MPAPIIEFVDVNVLLGGTSVDKFQFGALLGVFEHNVTPTRQAGPYFSIQEVNDAGFTSTATPAINAWASTVFAQDDGVESLLIGRREPALGKFVDSALQFADTGATFVDLTAEANSDATNDVPVFPTPDTILDYFAIGATQIFEVATFVASTLGVGGTCNWQYWDGLAWTDIPGVVDGTVDFTAGGTTQVTFTAPLDWATTSLDGGPQLYYIRAQNDGGYTTLPIITRTYVGVGDASYTATMDAIEAEDSTSWYITNIEARDDASIAEVAAWTESRFKIFMAQSDDVALVAFTALEAASYNRTAGWYYGSDALYLDGGASSSGGGLNLDAPGGVGIWAYRTLEGVPFSDIAGSFATSVYDVNANIYGRNKGVSFTSKGTMASGRFIDITTTIDWTQARLEEAIIALFVGTPTKIPYTNGGINLIVATVQGVLESGITFGHFSPDSPPRVIAPDVSEVSQQDKIDRVLTLTAEVVLAGAIQKVILNVNLTF